MQDDDKVTPTKPAFESELFSILGSLGDGVLITEAGLALLFNRSTASIKRAVTRGELPPPVVLLNRCMFSIGGIRKHMEKRFQAAQEEHEHLQNTLEKHRNLEY
ncbi:MAG: hypothetical protein COA73_12105 [Candidatus Hydrogenedentota bacterium]|nr:MAG: hypothetical protein COA73_12105 [Candidatus Hydrogenedentota bacterium]